MTRQKDDLDFVKKHIESFPKYQYYSRQYLSSDLSVSKMYVAKCKGAGCNFVSEWRYRKVFS